jgi:molybdenum cofactor cytidylyltransferase
MAHRLEAVVLAAGFGSRFGGGKLLSPWGGGVLLDGALAAAFAAEVRSVHVVWGADDRVIDCATAFARASGDIDRLRLIQATGFEKGLSASLAAGIGALPGDATAAFVFLGDMPRIPGGLTGAMIERLADGVQAVAPLFDARRGHPVLFARSLWPQLEALTGDRGAGMVLEGLGDRLALVPAPDDGVLFDVDRPSGSGALAI